jgi:hypothetical protein
LTGTSPCPAPSCSPPTTWPTFRSGGEGFGNIAWQFTKFPPGLLDRLAAWQRDFDDNYHYRTGWRSAATRDRWAHQATDLAADLRAALGTRAELVVDLWPIDEKT